MGNKIKRGIQSFTRNRFGKFIKNFILGLTLTLGTIAGIMYLWGLTLVVPIIKPTQNLKLLFTFVGISSIYQIIDRFLLRLDVKKNGRKLDDVLNLQDIHLDSDLKNQIEIIDLIKDRDEV